MRICLLCLLFLLFVCAAPVVVRTEQEPSQGHVLAIKAGRLLDVDKGTLVNDAVILIRGGHIETVALGKAPAIPPNAEVIDLAGATLLPGLIDAHVHLAWGHPERPGEVAGADDARKTLLAGFTTVRNLGSTAGADIVLRDAINAGRIAGPRMQAAGAALGKKGGVCDRVFAGEGVADNLAEAVERVRQLKAAGADIIKLCAGGGVLPSPEASEAVEYSEEEIRAIVMEAHWRGLRVAAHAHGPWAIQNAVGAGVDSVEHGGLIDETSARLMRDRNVYLVPTLYRLTWLVEDAQSKDAPASEVRKQQEARRLVVAHIRRAIALGVPIALGTDATVFPHGLNAHELSVYTRLGMPPLDTIRTATVNAAELMGWSDRVGSLAPGKFADVIAVEGNPLEDISVLEQVKFVMKGGQVFRNDFCTSEPDGPSRLLLAAPRALVAYPRGYRNWTHVKSALIGPQSPFYEKVGGFHHIYASEKAMEGYRTGRFPNGSVLVFDVLGAREGEGTTSEGPRRHIDVMEKDDRRFAATAGWGYEEFQGDSETERVLTAKAAQGCQNCHATARKHDSVFSRLRK